MTTTSPSSPSTKHAAGDSIALGSRVKPVAGQKPQIAMIVVAIADGVATCEYTRPRTKKARQLEFPISQLEAFDKAPAGYLTMGKYAGR